MKKTIPALFAVALCVLSLTLPTPVLAHDSGGGGGGGGKDGSSASGGGMFGRQGPHVEPLRGIEGFPTIPSDGRGGYSGMGWSPTDSPERPSQAKQTPFDSPCPRCLQGR